MPTKNLTKDETTPLNSSPSLSKNEQIIVDAIIACERASRLNHNFQKPGVTTYIDGVEIIWECPFGEPKGKMTINRNWGRPLTNSSLLGEKSNLIMELEACAKRLQPAEDDLRTAQSEYDRIVEAKDMKDDQGNQVPVSDAVIQNLANSAHEIEASALAIEGIHLSTKTWNERLDIINAQLPEQSPPLENTVIEVEL